MASPASYTAIDVGGSSVGNWIADTGFSGGSTTHTKATIASSTIVNPAPQAVYQSVRFAPSFTYTVSNLTPSAAYNVRLHFVESYFSAAGKRVFSAKINGTTVLTNLDIFAAAHGTNIAIVKSYSANALPTGQIALAFAATVNDAVINGIEFTKVTAAPTPIPTPIPTPTPVPTPSAAPTTQPHPGYGPRVAVGPQASITCPPSAVNIAAGTNIQSVVNAHLAGTTYCLAPGTFTNQAVIPKTGDTYVGAKGATLDGQNIARNAFIGSNGSSSVTIKNIVIKNYAVASANDAAVSARWYGNAGWNIYNNEISNSAKVGVGVATNSKVVANYIHDNQQAGYYCGNSSASSGKNIVFTDNKINDNNPSDVNGIGSSGGGKCLVSTNLVMKYNQVYGNHGPGIWDDTDNLGTDIEYNDVENNYYGGIDHEISWDAVIANNYLVNNAYASSAYCPTAYIQTYCSEIFIAESGGYPASGSTGVIDVFNNTIVGAAHGGGIVFKSENRNSSGFAPYSSWGPYQVKNVHVHNNIVDLSAGSVIGGTDDGTYPATFTSYGNSFNSDTYTGAKSTAFWWARVTESFSSFQAKGQESSGTSR